MLALSQRSWPNCRRDWGWIRNGLLTILDRTSEVWTPEDVWSSLQAGHSFLWAIEANGDDVGFVVLRKDSDPDGPVLYIWLCWAEPGALNDRADELIDRLDEIAARIGAKRIRFQSPRKGWAGFGDYFQATQVVFEREVSHV